MTRNEAASLLSEWTEVVKRGLDYGADDLDEINKLEHEILDAMAPVDGEWLIQSRGPHPDDCGNTVSYSTILKGSQEQAKIHADDLVPKGHTGIIVARIHARQKPEVVW